MSKLRYPSQLEHSLSAYGAPEHEIPSRRIANHVAEAQITILASAEYVIKITQPVFGSPTISTLTEGYILSHLAHPNVVSFVEEIIRPDIRAVVLERAECDLWTFVGSKRWQRRDDGMLACALKQLLEGLSFVHQRQIVHRDIKLENILVYDHMRLTLADFEMALPIDANPVCFSRIAGTIRYLSPELARTICNGPSERQRFGRRRSKWPYCPFANDRWALGVVAHYLAFDRHYMSFADVSIEEGLQCIAKCDAVACPPGHPATRLVEGLLTPQARRISLRRALAMPFIKEESSDPLVAGELSL